MNALTPIMNTGIVRVLMIFPTKLVNEYDKSGV